jgi:hypothetical protein
MTGTASWPQQPQAESVSDIYRPDKQIPLGCGYYASYPRTSFPRSSLA